MRAFSAIMLFLYVWLVYAPALLAQPASKAMLKARLPSESTATLASLSEPVVDPYVPWPTFYGVQQTGMVNTTFSCYGLIGYIYGPSSEWVPGWPEACFESPPGSDLEYLWGAALWIGGIVGDDTLVSHALDEFEGYEFRSSSHPFGSVTRFIYPTDYSMRAVFTDTITYGVPDDAITGRPHTPLHVRMANRSHIWRTPEYEDIVIYDLVVTNIGDHLIGSAFLGLFVDCDVGQLGFFSVDDVSGSIRDHGIAYSIDNDGEPEDGLFNPLTSPQKIFAVKLLASSQPLADTNFNWWQFENSLDGWGPRMHGTPEDPFFDFGTGGLGMPLGDRNKYYVLSHPEWDYDQVYTATIAPDDPVWLYPPEDIAEDITLGNDTRFLISWGPFDLKPDSSIRLLYATFTADDVHNFPLNCFLNLPDHPDGYIASLNFTDLLANSALAEERAEYLLDPLMPVPGLHVANYDADSIVVAWDPWVFDNIEGYEIFLSEVPHEQLPYPGVPAPWLRPQSLEPSASLGIDNRCKLPPLDPNKFHFVNVAQRSAMGVGSEGVPLIIGRPDSGIAPQPDCDYAFFYEGITVRFSFTDTTGWDIDHYCIYRLSDLGALSNLYRPFYSESIPSSLTPRDSFDIDGTTYYYFAMEPYAIIEAGTTVFEDEFPADGSCYIVTAVDQYGFETDFSRPVQSLETYLPTRDILVISGKRNVVLTPYDTVKNFYSEILGEYDWDIYHVSDTLVKYSCDHNLVDCVDWRDFTRFKMTIIDFESYDTFITPTSEERFARIKKLILSGARVVYCGCFEGLNYFYTWAARYYDQKTALAEQYFGADSLFYYDAGYYVYNGLTPDFDSCFGFKWAEPSHPDLPEIAFDTLRQVFSSSVTGIWWDKTPPSVSVFVPTDDAELLYRYRSRYPELSWLEGCPVGLRVHNDLMDTYLFGFHLWYMRPTQARELVDALFAGLSSTDIPEPSPTVLPTDFALRQNYPNPFNPVTEICYDLPQNARVTLEIFNILGQRVRTLIDGARQAAGRHTVEWRSDDDRGNKLSSGVYFYRLKAGDKTATKKMMLLK